MRLIGRGSRSVSLPHGGRWAPFAVVFGLVWGGLATSLPAHDGESDAQKPFTAEMAEHLLNRAGFGGTPAEISALQQLGRAKAVALMVDGPEGYDNAVDLPAFEVTLEQRPNRRKFIGLSREERQKIQREYRRKDRGQLQRYRAWWVDRMVGTRHPLIEKMTLFWHGHFTSSYRDVRNSYHMIKQNELFRSDALGSFEELLHAISKDPAMLEYLDNRSNRKGKPNENYAREVMELFTLGVGNYSEKDIKEAARAFTGWTFRGNEFIFNRRQHDFGKKVFLGKRGRFDGEDVLDMLLAHRETPNYIAGKLVTYFVGPNAPKPMVARYSRLLRKHDYELRPVLIALFKDDDFYREEVRCSRIMSPVELMVSMSRRLGLTPPGKMLASCADLLGQALMAPPNVKGWDGGYAWISTSTFLMRGNLTAYLVTGVNPGRVRRDFSGDGMKMTGRAARMLPGIRGRTTWKSPLRIRTLVVGLNTPEAIVDRLCSRFLAVPVTAEARESLITFCREAGTRTSDTFRPPTEMALKRLSRIVLSLPEAQLN